MHPVTFDFPGPNRLNLTGCHAAEHLSDHNCAIVQLRRTAAELLMRT